MDPKNKKPDQVTGPNLDLSIEALKGRQSVRATFRLSNEAIDLLSVVAGQLGIKQKSLFDQLVEDPRVLARVAEEARRFSPADQEEKRQKTFVISKSSQVSLNGIARKVRVPRDLLVEISIKRLQPIIDSELKKH